MTQRSELYQANGTVPLAESRRDVATYTGVVAAMITPCRAAGEIDARAAERLSKTITERGCDGVFVLSSTGELPLLDESERRELVQAVCTGVRPGSTVYAGISGTGLKQTLRHARHAAEDGADVAVAMAPFFLRFSQPELAAYLLELAERSPVPIALYHHLRMPTPIEVDTVARLAEHPNVVAIKDTSSDLQRLKHLVACTHGQAAVFQGSEKLVHESLEAGAAGCLTALAGVVPQWHAELLDAVRNGDGSHARAMQDRITHLWQMFGQPQMQESFSYFAHSLRLALVLQGWIPDTAGMMPGFVPDAAFERAIKAHLQQVGIGGGSPHA